MKKLHVGLNSTVIWQGNEVKKKFNSISSEISVTCLKALSFSLHFPKLLGFDEKSITIDYCGEQLSKENMPNDWEDQMYEILEDLKKAGIKHNDGVPKNLLIRNGTIILIDFGMAIYNGKQNVWVKTEEEVKNILKEGDEKILRRSFDFIRGKKIEKGIPLEIVPPYQLSPNTEWKEISKAISVFGTKKVDGSSMGPGKLYQKLPFHIKENDFAPRETRSRIEMMRKAYDFDGKVGIDFGCGTGAMVFALRKLGSKCFGIEKDTQALDVAWALENYYDTGARFLLGDALIHVNMLFYDYLNNNIFPFLVGLNKRLDFCLFLSIFMWILKEYGVESMFKVIHDLGELFDTMFFETSLGDAGAGDVMISSGLSNKESVIKFVEDNSAFRFESILGKSPDWYDRETIMFVRKEKKMNKKVNKEEVKVKVKEVNKEEVKVKEVNKDPIYLNLGCGTEILKDYINCDINGDKAGIKLDAKILPFEDCSVDRIRAYHLIEHFDFKEGFEVLKEWFRVLKPDGELILETPDMYYTCKKFVEGTEEDRIKLYGHFWAWPWLPGQAHKFLYTEQQLFWTLEKTGFRDILRVKPDSIYARSNPNWELLYLKVVCKK